jgi:hypothetical protein
MPYPAKAELYTASPMPFPVMTLFVTVALAVPPSTRTPAPLGLFEMLFPESNTFPYTSIPSPLLKDATLFVTTPLDTRMFAPLLGIAARSQHGLPVPQSLLFWLVALIFKTVPPELNSNVLPPYSPFIITRPSVPLPFNTFSVTLHPVQSTP